MAKRLHLIANNAGWVRDPTVQVSTIQLPMSHDGCWYETALQTAAGTQDLERYETMAEAVLGHQRYARQFHCTNDVVT